MFGIVIPYTIMYIYESILGSLVFAYTNFIKSVLLAISFKVYLAFWKSFEEHYAQKFSDDKSSKVFRGEYRGPYVRNLLTDELNEFSE